MRISKAEKCMRRKWKIEDALKLIREVAQAESDDSQLPIGSRDNLAMAALHLQNILNAS